MEEFGDFQQFDEINPLVLKFESMLLKGENPFFDTDEYEEIIEHYLMSNIDHAEIVVEHALSQFPWAAGILLKKAVVAAHRDKPDEAFEIVNMVKNIDSNNVDIYITLSYIHRIYNDVEKSIQALKKALTFNEDIDEIFFDISEDYSLLGQYDKETNYLIKCLKLNPSNFIALEKLFWSYKNQNNLQLAIDFYMSFIEENPLQQIAWEKLGFSYYELGLYEKSVEAFEYSLSIADQIPSYRGLAYSYWKLELHYQAIAILIEAIEKFSYSIDLNILIGWIYLDLKDFVNAQKYFLNEIFIDSSSFDAWKGLAESYIHFKDYNNAFSCINKVVSLSETDVESVIKLAFLAGELELEEKEIEQIFKNGIEKFPFSSQLMLEYSDFLFENNHENKAVQLLENSLKTIDDAAPIYYRIAAYNYLEGKDTIAHLHLIAGLNSDSTRLNLMFEYNSDLIRNESIMDILEGFNSAPDDLSENV